MSISPAPSPRRSRPSLPCCPGPAIARASWQDFGAVILVESLDEAPALADRLAPEHLEIATRDPDALAARINDAGAIFIGRYTPEVIGDYVAGTNHVLPTARSARFASGLGARFHEAHLDPEARRRQPRARSAPPPWRWPRPKASTPIAAPSPSG